MGRTKSTRPLPPHRLKILKASKRFTKSDIVEIFSKYGTITNAYYPKAANKGWVEFDDLEEAENAFEELDNTLVKRCTMILERGW